MLNSNERKKAAALQYERDQDTAPRLVAKGQGHVADRILEIAQQNQIPVHQDPALIEILSKMDLQEEIPAECYRVVAEILAFIYKTQQKLRNPANSA
jgi:flagellar biosynthesis protein